MQRAIGILTNSATHRVKLKFLIRRIPARVGLGFILSDNAFPADFLWGAATSAYQIEGSPLADGAGASNWHRFSHTRGNTNNDETGDVACDHYNRWRDDVALMRELGLNAYRFSISWSRVLPSGVGPVNENGLDFYRRLVDALLAANITPLVTL